MYDLTVMKLEPNLGMPPVRLAKLLADRDTSRFNETCSQKN